MIPAKKLSLLKAALALSWSRETSADPTNWSEDNPSWGQCAVTALVVHEHCGGEIVRGAFPGGSHYWNVIDEEPLDLTIQQWEAPPEFTDISSRTVEYLLSNESTANRYGRLSSEVLTKLLFLVIDKNKEADFMSDVPKIPLQEVFEAVLREERYAAGWSQPRPEAPSKTDHYTDPRTGMPWGPMDWLAFARKYLNEAELAWVNYTPDDRAIHSRFIKAAYLLLASVALNATPAEIATIGGVSSNQWPILHGGLQRYHEELAKQPASGE